MKTQNNILKIHSWRYVWSRSLLVIIVAMLIRGNFDIYIKVDPNRVSSSEHSNGEFNQKPGSATDFNPILEFSTYLGGNQTEWESNIAVDKNRGIYLVGTTYSMDFPTLNSFNPTRDIEYLEIYVTKFNSDGTLGYSTYIGGNSEEWGLDIVVDEAGAVYITGYTDSSDFPTQNAYQGTQNSGMKDAFITKLNPDGSLNYSTYFGGLFDDRGYGIEVDKHGAVYLTGHTTSFTDFPIQNAFDPTYNDLGDIFVTKFNPSGIIEYSTFLGGTDNEFVLDIAIDNIGAVYLTGCTHSADFPTFNAYDAAINENYRSDVFITKFNSNGSLGYSTFLGGSYDDWGRGITVDDIGAVYVTGETYSADFPTLNAYDVSFDGNPDTWIADAFVAKFNSNGTLGYSTFLGGSSNDMGMNIGLEETGAVWVIGGTDSADFPTLNAFDAFLNGSTDVFVTKFNSDGILGYSTFLGGSSNDWGECIMLDETRIYLAGITNSSDFPIQNAYDATSNSKYPDTFISVLKYQDLKPSVALPKGIFFIISIGATIPVLVMIQIKQIHRVKTLQKKIKKTII